MFVITILASVIILPVIGVTSDNTEVFKVRQLLQSGSGWKKAIPEGRVDSIEAVLRRESGSTDTFVNLRFEGNETFENGKRVQIDWRNDRVVSWDVAGARSEGRPLVLNAYNGNIYVEEIRVHYQDDRREAHRSDREHLGRSAFRGVDGEIAERCRERQNREPQITIESIKSGSDFFASSSGEFAVSGSVAGTCVQEVGYFEHGKLKSQIEMPVDDRFRRQDFEIKARTGRDAEIRAYTLDGQEDRVSIDHEIDERS